MAYTSKRNGKSSTFAKKRLAAKRGYKCEQCGYPGGYLAVHHKKTVVNGGTYDDENLLLLCEVCHNAAHGKKTMNFIDPKRKSWRG